MEHMLQTVEGVPIKAEDKWDTVLHQDLGQHQSLILKKIPC